MSGRPYNRPEPAEWRAVTKSRIWITSYRYTVILECGHQFSQTISARARKGGRDVPKRIDCPACRKETAARTHEHQQPTTEG